MADSGDGRDAAVGARAGTRAPGRRRAPSLSALTSWLVFLAGTLALVTLALLVRRVGPWVGEPRGSTAPRELPTITAAPQTRTLIAPSRPPVPSSSDGSMPLVVKILIIAVVALVVMVLLGAFVRMVRRFAGRNNHDRQSGAGRAPELGVPEPPAPVPQDAGRDFDPRAAADAIVSCWLWIEEAAGVRGHPRRPSSTPTEFLDDFIAAEHRDTDGAAVARRAAQEFLPLYQRARFHHELLTADAAVVARAAAHTLIGGAIREPVADEDSAAPPGEEP